MTRSPRFRRRAASGALCLLLLALLAGLLRAPATVERAPAAAVSVASGRSASAAGVSSGRPPPAPASAAPAPAWEGPTVRVAAVRLEKTSVCRGEENLVTVEAVARPDLKAGLRARVGGDDGFRVPVRGVPDARGRNKARKVFVFAEDGQIAEADVPDFEVRDCEVAALLLVRAGGLPNRPETYRFEARLKPYGEAELPAIARYVWRFEEAGAAEGDAEEFTTPTPELVRDLSRRPQSARATELLVTVTAVPAEHAVAPVVGRQSLVLENLAYIARHDEGYVRLDRALDPLYPALEPDGVVRQGVRLFHHDAGPVRIAKVVRTALLADGREQATEVDVASVLGRQTIDADEDLDFVLRLDTRAEPDVTAVNYTFEGEAADGAPVHGAASVLRPARREEFQPIADAALEARVRRATQLLGKSTVTADELAALSAQGRL